MPASTLPSSFRDPSGFLFTREGVLYRQINVRCREDYELLMKSGLYEALAGKRLIIPHREADIPPEAPGIAHKVIRPDVVPFVSYPYEWCFSQLKDAALATLEIQRAALDSGMSLKDASAYNIQFAGGRPLLVDTLSFERLDESRPWVAYRQFCRHFLAPLALASRTDARLSQLMRVYIDGVPLDLASKLLPGRTKLSFGLLSHIHLHAKFESKYAGSTQKPSGGRMGKMALWGLIDNLQATVRKLGYKPARTEWADYYSDTNYSGPALADKARVVSEFLDVCRPATVWDLGANIGVFSRIAAGKGAYTVAFDIDPAAVEKHYLDCRAGGIANTLPLVLDLANPSAAIGWANRERMSLVERGPADAVMALALVHHLAISNNVPLGMLAEFLASICRWLVIEFVPKSDSQVKRLLVTREDIFGDYNQDSFEREFAAAFDIEKRAPLAESERTLYLMRRRA